MSATDTAFEILARRVHGRVVRNASLAPLTSYRLGGPATILLDASGDADLDALAEAVRESSLPMLVVGRGSNLLISDHGFDGIALRLGAGFRWSRVEETLVHAGAAVPLPALAALTADHGLAGFEFAAAIPASLGGAVRMNAGAHGGEIGDVLSSAQGITIPEGDRVTVQQPAHSYRSMDLPAGLIVTAATLSLTRDDPAAVLVRIKETREWRREHQPLDLPNAGSVFKNPPGDAAGRLIETVCRGESLGGARVSDVHANFIVAGKEARAADVYGLIRRVQRAVHEATGIMLEPEVRFIGRFDEE